MPENQPEIKRKKGRPRAVVDEREVRELAALGASDSEIARLLGVSERTIRSFRAERSIPSGCGHGGRRPGAGRKPQLISGKRKKNPWTGHGRGGWPAWQAATKWTVSDAEFVEWNHQEYIHVGGGVYKFDESRAGKKPSDAPGRFRF